MNLQVLVKGHPSFIENASTWLEHIGIYWMHMMPLLALLILPLVYPLVLIGGMHKVCLPKGFMHRVSCKPDTTLYIAENKTLAGK